MRLPPSHWTTSRSPRSITIGRFARECPRSFSRRERRPDELVAIAEHLRAPPWVVPRDSRHAEQARALCARCSGCHRTTSAGADRSPGRAGCGFATAYGPAARLRRRGRATCRSQKNAPRRRCVRHHGRAADGRRRRGHSPADVADGRAHSARVRRGRCRNGWRAAIRVGGLVRVPVIAVPTSVGYGASFGGSRRC